MPEHKISVYSTWDLSLWTTYYSTAQVLQLQWMIDVGTPFLLPASKPELEPVFSNGPSIDEVVVQ